MPAKDAKEMKEKRTGAIVYGHHPSAHLAALLLAEKRANVLHVLPPGPPPADAPALLNPAFFKLHKRLKPLADALDLAPVHGLAFLADDPSLTGRYAADEPLAHLARTDAVRDALAALANEAGVRRISPKSFSVDAVDETGLHATADGGAVDAKLLLLADALPPDSAAAASIPPAWPDALLRRVSRLALPPNVLLKHDGPPVVPMSLDLGGNLCWAWLLIGPAGAQAVVEQPVAADAPGSKTPPADLMNRWLNVLTAHGHLAGRDGIELKKIASADLPLGGALERDAVADLTLLLGPAGGFYAATGEDLYPACWSATFAAHVAAAALNADHPQDALSAYRGKWGASLGDYLRGPQQNLRLLLPLIYKNPQMTARFAEAILLGKNVVR